MKLNKIAAALAFVPLTTVAQQQVPAIEQHPHGSVEMAIHTPPVKFDEKDREALRLVREWKKHPDKPRRAADGSVKYLFGASLPTLVCTPLQVCAIRFQEGEVVNDVNIGDGVRWKITPATVGSGENAITHAIVQPKEPGLSTNAIITTDRRVYTIALKSAKHEWMPSISFDYPDDMERAWAKYQKRQERHVYATTMPSGEKIGDLDFGFKLSGDSPKWKPKRVYAYDGKTYIQFPSAISSDEAPALVALDGGGFFSDPSEQIVNYRAVPARNDPRIVEKYVVDQVLDRAALILGVGSDQVRVTIEREAE